MLVLGASLVDNYPVWVEPKASLMQRLQADHAGGVFLHENHLGYQRSALSQHLDVLLPTWP